MLEFIITIVAWSVGLLCGAGLAEAYWRKNLVRGAIVAVERAKVAYEGVDYCDIIGGMHLSSLSKLLSTLLEPGASPLNIKALPVIIEAHGAMIMPLRQLLFLYKPIGVSLDDIVAINKNNELLPAVIHVKRRIMDEE